MRVRLALLAMWVASGTQAEAPETAPRPIPRPEAPVEASICGDPAILGRPMRPILSATETCGVEAPVRVTSVAGLRLNPPATIDCRTASALRQWAEDSVRPAVGRRGGGAAGLTVTAHYICRTRNRDPDAKVSEHGRGRAIDISAIRLADGSEITVLKGWKRWRQRGILRRIHKGACGPFGTVLGPDADRFHRDHFHLDTARYRSGSYCR